MKIYRIPIIMASFGAFIIMASTIRWFFLYPDMSQFVLASFIGVIVLGFAYIYQWMKDADEFHKKIEKRIDAIVDWWTKNDIKEEFK